MIQVQVTMTSKSFSPRANWAQLAREHHTFGSMAEARAWLAKEYGESKRQSMYLDSETGTRRVGYVIGFRNADYSHSPVEHWLQRDWVEFKEVTPVTV